MFLRDSLDSTRARAFAERIFFSGIHSYSFTTDGIDFSPTPAHSMSPGTHRPRAAYTLPHTTTPANLSYKLTQSQVVTDIVQQKLERKRANARLRQQRCRARKRARALEDKEAKEGKKNPRVMKDKENQPTMSTDTKSEDKSSKQVPIKPAVAAPVQKYSNGVNWQLHTSQNKKKDPTAPDSSGSWNQSQSNVYPQQGYYAHAYGQWYGAWNQASAAYYGGRPPYPYPTQGFPHTSGVPSVGLEHNLPPASPFQLVSPKSDDKSRSSSKSVPDASTPYHELEAMVKSPIRSFHIAQTPMVGDGMNLGMYSPTLPPTWSTGTKDTPAFCATQSPWLGALPSPSIMTTSPAVQNKDTKEPPSLPLTTPVKMTTKFRTWQTKSPSRETVL